MDLLEQDDGWTVTLLLSITSHSYLHCRNIATFNLLDHLSHAYRIKPFPSQLQGRRQGGGGGGGGGGEGGVQEVHVNSPFKLMIFMNQTSKTDYIAQLAMCIFFPQI